MFILNGLLKVKCMSFFDDRATEFLINLFSFIYAAIWGGLAFVGTKYHWFLIISLSFSILSGLFPFN